MGNCIQTSNQVLLSSFLLSISISFSHGSEKLWERKLPVWRQFPWAAVFPHNTVAESTNKIVEEKKAEVVKENITKDKVDEQVQNTQEIAIVTPDGETLYKVCASCHGQKAEKEALGKSQIIAGWDKQRTVDALNGYKKGTYGGSMKNIMKGHVSSKTDTEIEALADLISKM